MSRIRDFHINATARWPPGALRGVCFRQQNGEGYCTYWGVRSERVGGKVRQLTLLNLGRRFPIRPQHGPLLCSRVGQLLHPQEALLSIECAAPIERAAQRYFGQSVARSLSLESATAGGTEASGLERAAEAQRAG